MGGTTASAAVSARPPSPPPPPPVVQDGGPARRGRSRASDDFDDPDERPRRRSREEDDYDDPDERPRRRRRDEEEDDDRPRRRKKKKEAGSSKGLIIGLSLGGVGLLVGGVVLFFVLRGGSSAPRPGPVGPGPVGGGAGDFTSAAGKYRVAFPRAPQQKSQPGPLGTTVNLALVEERNGVYMVGYTDMPIPAGEPPDAVRQRLIGSQNGALANMGGRATSQREIMLQGKYPGREFTGTMSKGPPGSRIRARIYLVGTRLYQVFVLGNGGISEGAEATRFLDSFAYLE